MAVMETIERTERRIGGVVYPVTITRRVGLETYTGAGGKPILADEATFMDFGPRLGVQRTYILHPEVEPTEAERAAGRELVKETAIRAMIEQGIW